MSASMERHMDQCAGCRAQLSPLADFELLEAAWAGVSTTIESPPLPWAIRRAERLGLPEPTGILLAAAASLRGAWLSSAFLALSFAVAAALLGSGELWPFLLVAPLIPMLGVAVSYGSSSDAFDALAVTAPFGRTRLILLRTIAVLVTTVPAACLVGLALPGPTWVAAAWLGPALAMLSLLFVLASYFGPRVAAPLVALVWSGTVLLSAYKLPATWPVETGQQVVYAAVTASAVAILAYRAHESRHIGDVL
jgi:hypothetical protein